MSKAIIDFEKGDISALKEIASTLQAIIDREGAVGEAWKQTSADMNAQSKTNVDTTNKLAQSIDQLSVASKSMDKVVIGGAFANTLKQLQSQLGLTNNEIINFIQNSRKSAQQEILNPANSKETIDQLTLSIQVMNDQLKQMGVSEDSAGAKSQNFTSQIRAVRNELLAMTEAGQSGTAEFAALENKYSEMQRISKQFQIESQGLVQNSEVLNGISSILTGVAGAYQVATGAAILFGDGNQDLQKAMQKLFAVMSLVQGLEQVTAVLQKSSAANILLESLARKKQAAAITETNVAEGTNIALTEEQTAKTALQTTVTEGAEIAQRGLNLAILSSPVGILLLAVTELVGIYQLFAKAEEERIQEMKNEIAATELAIKINDEFNASIKAGYDQAILNAKLLGSSLSVIRQLETSSLKEQVDATQKLEQAKRDQYTESYELLKAFSEGSIVLSNDEVDQYKKIIVDYNKITKTLDDLKVKYETKQKEDLLQINKDTFNKLEAMAQTSVAKTISGTDAERNAEIKAIEDIAAARKKSLDFQSKKPEEQALIEAEDQKKIDALKLQNLQHSLKDRTAAIETQISDVKAIQATSDAEQIAQINKISDLQIAAIKKQAKEQIKGNPTLNQDEKNKINADANLAIVEAEKKKQADILNVQKAELSLQLAATEKGSYDEYVYKLALLENSRQAEIAAAGKNADLIKAINLKFNKERQDADNAYDGIRLQNEVNLDNAALDNFNLTEQQKLPIVIKRLNEQEQIELLGAQNNAAKIAEINAKYDKQRIEATKASIDAELALNIKAFDTLNEIGTQKSNAIISDPLASPVAKQIANDTLLKNEQFKTDLERDALEKQKLLLSTEDYSIKLQAIENEEDANKLKHSKTAVQIFQDEQNKKLAILNQTISVFQNSLNALDTGSLQTGLNNALTSFSQIAKAISDYKAALKDPNADKAAAKDAESAAIRAAAIIGLQNTLNQLYTDQAAARQQQLSDTLSALETEKNAELNNANLTAKQKDAINMKYAAKEKQAKLAAWEADKQAKKEQIIIEGALNVVKAFPNVILMAVAAALTLIEVGVVGSQKPPKFRHGQIDIQGPGTSTSDSIPSLISRGESVIKAESTAKWKDALVAINDDKFEDYLGQKFKGFVFPHIPDTVSIPTGKSQEIDYDRLAIAMAEKMKGVIPEPTHVNNIMTVDENGIRKFFEKGNTRTEWKNKRYSMQ